MIDVDGLHYAIEVAIAIGLLVAVCIWLAEKRDRNK